MMMRYVSICLAVLLLTMRTGVAVPGPGELGILETVPQRSTVFTCGFEDDSHGLNLRNYEVDSHVAHSGIRSLTGTIDGPRQACSLRVPFRGMAGRRLEIGFWVRSTDRTRCAVWVNDWDATGTAARKRRALTSQDNLPNKWVQIKGSVVPETDGPGYFEIVTPSSHGDQPPGRAWIDDITLTAGVSTRFTLGHAEDFPALTTDGSGHVWLAVVARPVPDREIRVFEVAGGERHPAAVIKPEGMTGIGVPALAPLPDGCVLTVPVELDDGWRIAYAFIDALGSKALTCRYLDVGSNVNMACAVTSTKGRTVVAWESNRGGRGIHAAEIHASAPASAPVRLSSPDAPSANPDITALPDGRFFAAWDSLRGKSVDIYGAWCADGEWQPERRLTSDPRIERHVSLAAHGHHVWMAWQAQSFKRHLVNSISEQRIVVAQLEERGALVAPVALFDIVSPGGSQLMRPRITLDPGGRLWVTARRSMDAHQGWQPVAWSYGGDAWTGPYVLWSDQGRWRPVPMAFDPSGTGVAACQRDNLPRYWGVNVGKASDWSSDIVLMPLPVQSRTDDLIVRPLAMPTTDFALSNRMNQASAHLARQRVNHEGHSLSLFWGDMHEHTDMSVCQRACNPPADDLYANQRDIEVLDFTALTDHGYNIDRPQWQYTVERVRAFHDPGAFVSLLGEEWTSDQHQYDPKRSYRRYGHRNHIFRDTYFPRFFDSRDGAITPRMVWDELKDVEFIAIPHQLADTGNCPTDWTFHDEQDQPLAEIFQQRQSYEYYGCPRQAPGATPFEGHFLQDAWALGIVIGVIASPDHGGGAGKAGVWCEALTRDDLFKAFHARHTFGTSGAKMALFVSTGRHIMGDKVLHSERLPIPFRVRAVADRPITRLVIMRNNQVVHEAAPGAARVDMVWTDAEPPDEKQLWYYVRIHREDEELAWSSPIWFFKTPQDLAATRERADQLPQLYPAGVPSGGR